jgi:hypothetical protein
MIEQTYNGLNSRSEANPFFINGNLPLITAPMFATCDETNYKEFLENQVNVCLPRGVQNVESSKYVFLSYSVEEFENIVNTTEKFEKDFYVCIDTANGNMPKLHNVIKLAKQKFGNNVVIMAGNVCSLVAFQALVVAGADYIRVGIGGGGSCHTTKNTAIGQTNLNELVRKCYEYKMKNRKTCKIVADGISQYIKYCEKEFGYNDNGYAAIIELLYAGADLVMVGRLFVQSFESSGGKLYKNTQDCMSDDYLEDFKRIPMSEFNNKIDNMFVVFAGMSSQIAQKKYGKTIKPSEGAISIEKVRWFLKDWLFGNEMQDHYPFLNGFENSLRSAMSYTGSKTLEDFKMEIRYNRI